MLRDILKGDESQILAARDVIAAVDPDILLLTRFDYDLGLSALTAFADSLQLVGSDYPYRFAVSPNSGVATGLDLDGNGWLGDARDAQGYGDFAGHGGMAVLSRYPIDVERVRNFSGFLWRDLPGAQLPDDADADIQRLSSVAHWDVPILLPEGPPLHLLAYHATTPAFDGPEDRNGMRNRDETMFWLRYLDGELPWSPPIARFVIIGDANLDPMDGEGDRRAITALLHDTRLQDPKPKSVGAVEASLDQGGVNLTHRSNPALDTADWKDTDGPGNLRVDYVLPSRDLKVLDAGVFWPASDDNRVPALRKRDPDTSWHGLVWIDVAR